MEWTYFTGFYTLENLPGTQMVWVGVGEKKICLQKNSEEERRNKLK